MLKRKQFLAILVVSWVLTSSTCEATPSTKSSLPSIVGFDYLSDLTSSVFSFLGDDEEPSSPTPFGARKKDRKEPVPKSQEKTVLERRFSSGLSDLRSKKGDLGRKGKKIFHRGKQVHRNAGFKGGKRHFKDASSSLETVDRNPLQNGVGQRQHAAGSKNMFSKELEQFAIGDVVGETFLNKLDMAIWKHGIQNEGQLKVLESLLGDIGPKHGNPAYPPGSVLAQRSSAPNRMVNKQLSSIIEEDTSKLTVDNVVTDKSSEVRDLALKKWLKLPKDVSKLKGEKTIEELSYKILSLVDHEKDTKAEEENDKQIYTAVLASMAAYQIRKLRRQLRHGRVKRDEERVCYRDLGCFTDEGAFDYFDYLPDPPEEIGTKFLLFTRENIDKEQVITISNSSIGSSKYDPSKLTKMVVHGFGSSCDRPWVRSMTQALLTMMDVNILCVDWENGATVPNYMRAASNTRLVGRQVSQMIKFLTTATNASLASFHLIGFSLGAHVSGHAGKALKLKRISGLDPAGPLFENSPASVRLDRSDAEYVDVIHTNAESLLWGGLGAYQPMGHVDFYPNGGRMQKGCANLFVGGVSDILWPTEGDGRSLCNHRRGYKYFVESIAPVCKFPSFVCSSFETFLTGECFPCKNCGNMGYYSDRAKGRGQLYLVTRESEPFCANQYKVSLKHSGGPPLLSAVSTYGRIDVTFIGADGINETIPLTRMADEEVKAGSTSTRILVPHPAITGIKSIQLLYTAYDGWVYSGSRRWAIDKVSLMDSYGDQRSFCRLGVTLETGVPMVLQLNSGDCTPQYRPWRNKKPFGTASTPHRNVSDESTFIEEAELEMESINNTTPHRIADGDTSVTLQNKHLYKFVPENHETGDISTNFAVIRPGDRHSPLQSTNSSHSSVLISFPKPLSDSTDTKSASASFSVSLPSSIPKPISEYPSYSIQNSGNFQQFSAPSVPSLPSHSFVSPYFEYPSPSELRTKASEVNPEFKIKETGHKTQSNASEKVDKVTDNFGLVKQDAASEAHIYNQDVKKPIQEDVSHIKEGPAPNLYPENVHDNMERNNFYAIEHISEDPVKILEAPQIVPDTRPLPTLENRHHDDRLTTWGTTGQFISYPHHYNNPNIGQDSGQSTSYNSFGSDQIESDRKDVESQTPSSYASDLTSTYTDFVTPSNQNAYSSRTPVKDSLFHLLPKEDNKPTGVEDKDQFSYVVHNDKGEQGLLVLGAPESSSIPPPEGTQSLKTFFGTEKLALDGLDSLPENIKIIPYNSLIDGEIPINEMAKALFGKASDRNQIIFISDPISKSPVSVEFNSNTTSPNDSPNYESHSSYHSYDVPPPALYSPTQSSFASYDYTPAQVEYTSESIVPRPSLLTNSYVQLSRHIPSTKQIDSQPPVAASPKRLPEFLRPPSLINPSYLSLFDSTVDEKRLKTVRPSISSEPNSSTFKRETDATAASSQEADESSGLSIFPKIFTNIAEQFSLSAIAGYPEETESNEESGSIADIPANSGEINFTTKAHPQRDKGQKLRPSLSLDTLNKTELIRVPLTSEAPSIFSWRYYFGSSSEVDNIENIPLTKESLDSTSSDDGDGPEESSLLNLEDKASKETENLHSVTNQEDVELKLPAKSDHKVKTSVPLLHPSQDRIFVAESTKNRQEKSLDVGQSSTSVGRPPIESSSFDRSKLPRIRSHHNKRLMRFPESRRHSKSIYRYLPRILTPSSSHRRVQQNLGYFASPKQFAPNYPFLQLDPFTALPTRLMAPPPPPRSYRFNSYSPSEKSIDEHDQPLKLINSQTQSLSREVKGKLLNNVPGKKISHPYPISLPHSSEFKKAANGGSVRRIQSQDTLISRSLRHNHGSENDFIYEPGLSSKETPTSIEGKPDPNIQNDKMSQPILDLFYPKTHLASNTESAKEIKSEHSSPGSQSKISIETIRNQGLLQVTHSDLNQENFNKRSGEVQTVSHEFLLGKEISRLPDPIHSSQPSYEFSPYFPYPRIHSPSHPAPSVLKEKSKSSSTDVESHENTNYAASVPKHSPENIALRQSPSDSRHYLTMLETAAPPPKTYTASTSYDSKTQSLHSVPSSFPPNSRAQLQNNNPPSRANLNFRGRRIPRRHSPTYFNPVGDDRSQKSYPVGPGSSNERILTKPHSPFVVPDASGRGALYVPLVMPNP